MISDLVSAGIPALNAAEVLGKTIRNLRAEGIEKITVVDDGSTDSTAKIAREERVEVIQNSRCLGRGAARKRLIDLASAKYQFQIDAGNTLAADFVSRALVIAEELEAAAVFGGFRSLHLPRSVGGRWRARHLYKDRANDRRNEQASLSTGAVLLNCERVRAIGNFNAGLRSREDWELGERLLAGGNKVVCEPALRAFTEGSDRAADVFRRYLRWNIGHAMSLAEYRKQLGYCYRSLLKEDFQAGDLPAAMLTLILPHYLFFASRKLE